MTVRPPPKAPPRAGKREATFGRATSLLFAGNSVAQVLVAMTFVVIARELGRPVFGLTVALLGVAAIGQDLLDFGTSQWMSREMAGGRISWATARRIFRRRSGATTGLCVLLAVGAAILGAPASEAAGVCIYVVGAVANAGMHARLRAQGRFRRSAIHLAFERLAWLAFTLALTSTSMGPQGESGALIGGMGVAYICSLACAPRLRVTTTGAQPPLTLRRVYRNASSFGILGLSSDVQQLDATIAATIGSVGVAADVGVASKLTGPLGLLATAVSQVVFRNVAAGGAEGRRSERLAMLLSSGVGIIVALLSPVLPIIAVLVLGEQYANAYAAISIYTLGTALGIVNQTLASILTAHGRDRIVSVLVAVSVISGLLMGSALVTHVGAAGMGLGFLTTQAAIFGGCLLLRRKKEVRREPSSATATRAFDWGS